ncbi:MAG: 4-hydroxy-tetrahydrodipicolinate synthase [Kiritimatiellae bacterium]|nr:4-hydroxy-tetrahydrodipicolinate synthase [Kiritimatiellia bacterium]MBR4523320.1 4-hydroxy-tetrahydrodipicolinate synthase [Kiritimatiellia bacterium]
MTLSGTITAMVTPFGKAGEVDYGRLEAIVEEQVAAGIEGICAVGTTGESPTLSHEEHHQVIEKTIEYAKGRCLIVAGTGANSTDEAVSLTKAAIAMGGADASLQVTPYYNKPNAEGLYRHFMTVADLGLPVILYNVPGRAGKEIPLDVVARLAKHPNVVAIKEAAGSVERVSAIKNLCPDFTVLSGDDSLAVPMMSVGAKGVISVASNVIPKEVGDMVRAALRGDFVAAGQMHAKYYPLFHDLFIDTNPVMVKEALAMLGKIELSLRLPLAETTEANRAKLRATLDKVLGR